MEQIEAGQVIVFGLALAGLLGMHVALIDRRKGRAKLFFWSGLAFASMGWVTFSFERTQVFLRWLLNG